MVMVSVISGLLTFATGDFVSVHKALLIVSHVAAIAVGFVLGVALMLLLVIRAAVKGYKLEVWTK